MKKTIIAVAMAAFISTGAIAKPMPHNAPKPHNAHQVHMVSHAHKPAPHKHHHSPTPVVVHHHHNHADFGDVLIAFAILATAL